MYVKRCQIVNFYNNDQILILHFIILKYHNYCCIISWNAIIFQSNLYRKDFIFPFFIFYIH